MVKEFNKFENKYNLFDLIIDDLEIWNYIRFELFFSIGEHFNIKKGKGYTPKKSLKDKFFLIYNTFIKNPYLTIKKNDILIIPHQRRILEGNKYRCIYTDEISEKLPYKCISAEFLFGRMHYKPAKTKNIIYLDYIDVLAGLKYKKIKLNKFKDISDYLSKIIKEYFGVIVETDSIAQLISKRYYWHKYKKKYIKKLILKVKPKIILEVVGYETNKMIVNEVAHELDIPCIELQHGVIGKGHIAYNYDTKKKLKQLPSYLFVYSDYWKQTCSFPIGENHIIATGFPYMEEQVKKFPKKIGKEGMLRIIIYSSPDSTKNLQIFTEELITQLEVLNFNFTIIYKLHPLEYNYPSDLWNTIKASKNVVFIDSPKFSLYELCANADIQIGVKTTALFEGLVYNLKTFILDTGIPNLEAYMNDLIEEGYAIYVKNVNELIESIKNDKTILHNNSDRKSPFFMRNSLNNISSEIQNILQKYYGSPK